MNKRSPNIKIQAPTGNGSVTEDIAAPKLADGVLSVYVVVELSEIVATNLYSPDVPLSLRYILRLVAPSVPNGM